jgi:hypothetical protein
MNKLGASWIQVCRALALTLGLSGVAVAQSVSPGSAEELELGRRIYNDGVIAPGVELTGIRAGNPPTSGARAACVNCHRRSGMGQVDSDILIQPITGNFLFASKEDKRVTTMDPHVGKRFNQTHEPYTFAALDNAIRNGVNNRGQTMDAAMPRFNLNDTQLKAVIAYLKQLSVHWSPGVSQTSIRFATVITPDVEPARRKVFIDMMRAIFRQKNGSTVTANQGKSRHHMISAAEMILGTERKWELDIWELQGAPQTWNEQLAANYRKNPVFALVSGVSNSTWQPVHDFCDREHVPGWFPSVDMPGKDPSLYTFYFSGGVTLESAVLARHLLDQKESPKRVVQIYRDTDVARAAAQSLTHSLAGSPVKVEDRVMRADLAAEDALRQALGSIKPDDSVMFWLRPNDIAALEKIKPMSGKSYFSSVLGKGDQAPLPVKWRANSSLVYLHELPENRAKNIDNFNVWQNLSKIALVDQSMQSEVFFSLSFLTDTLAEMLDNMYRDYLMERAENMLSVREGIKSEQETRDRVALGRTGDLIKKHGPLTIAESSRIPIPGQGSSAKSKGTTLYPNLSLGPDQRFASKGGYIVRLANDTGIQLQAQSELIVP